MTQEYDGPFIHITFDANELEHGPFEPILVTGDDGNEYNVIPSDQFK